MRLRSLAVLLAAAAWLSGCYDGPPKGQVVASVDGDDLTRRDLAAEVSADGRVPSAADMRGPILDRLVARKLLVHEAERRKLQQTPEYLAAVRRQRDLILSSLLRQDIEASIPGPSATEASDYIDTHPWQFARRFASLVEPVSSARSGLTSRFWQDSFDLTRSDADRLWAIPIGGRATISVRGTTIPVILIAQMPNPVSGIDSRHAASTILRKQEVDAAVAATLERARHSASIQFQTGFGPAAE